MKVRIANSPQELAAIMRLRYEVNVGELNKSFLSKDQSDLLTDMRDTNAQNLYVEQDTQVVGTVRYSISSYNDYIKDHYCVRHPLFDLKFLIADRMVVRKDRRGMAIPVALTNQMYKTGLERGVHAALVECELPLVPFYERMGMIKYDQIRRSYGTRALLYIDMLDIAHLRRVGSTFARVYDAHCDWVKGVFDNGYGVERMNSRKRVAV